MRLIDIDRAVEHLTQKQKQALFLVGKFGATEELVGELLGVSQQAISKRLSNALDSIVSYLNGEYPE